MFLRPQQISAMPNLLTSIAACYFAGEMIETKEQVIGPIKTDNHAAEFVQYGID